MGDLVWVRIFFSQTSEDRRFPLTLIYNYAGYFSLARFFPPRNQSIGYFFFLISPIAPTQKSNGRPLRQHYLSRVANNAWKWMAKLDKSLDTMRFCFFFTLISVPFKNTFLIKLSLQRYKRFNNVFVVVNFLFQVNFCFSFVFGYDI